MNELSERLAVLDEALAKCSSPVYVPSKAEVKKFILEMKNVNSDRILVNSLISNIIVDPYTKDYVVHMGVPHFSTK